MSASMNTILIIGGTSGIGEEFAKRFASMGKKVIVTGRREQKLADMQRFVKGLEVYKMDMTDFSSVPGDIDNLFTTFPDIDTVWVNGGIQKSSSVKDVSSTTDARVTNEITTNLTAPIILSRHVVPRLLKQETETNFIITSSGLGYVPVGSLFSIYCSTKAAVHGYMVGIRQDLKDTNVNVLEIVPPFVGGTGLAAEDREKLKGKPLPTPMKMSNFADEIFEKLNGSQAKDLKEIAAGSAVGRVEAWRSSIGEMLKKSGLGG